MYGLPVDDSQYPHFSSDDFEHDTVITDPQLPVPFERTLQRRAIEFRVSRESFLD